jgi:peroxiredoxin
MTRPLPQTPAPVLDLPLVGGGRFTLGEQQPNTFTLIVFYRGWHCPICRGYLQQLQKALPELEGLGVTTVAVSADTDQRARRSVDEWHLDKLPVAYGQTEESMRQWGLYLSKAIKDPEPNLFGEPGIYLIKPDGTIHMAGLNSMPAARPRIEDLVGAIKYFTETHYPARGEA